MSESFQALESEAQDQTLPELLLDFDSRKKCRFRATDSEGHVVEAFLPRGTVLTHG
ncbi:MAG: urease accessory protein UreE, partial [Gammaproteobacteria bacterium]